MISRILLRHEIRLGFREGVRYEGGSGVGIEVSKEGGWDWSYVLMDEMDLIMDLIYMMDAMMGVCVCDA